MSGGGMKKELPDWRSRLGLQAFLLILLLERGMLLEPKRTRHRPEMKASINVLLIQTSDVIEHSLWFACA